MRDNKHHARIHRRRILIAHVLFATLYLSFCRWTTMDTRDSSNDVIMATQDTGPSAGANAGTLRAALQTQVNELRAAPARGG